MSLLSKIAAAIVPTPGALASEAGHRGEGPATDEAALAAGALVRDSAGRSLWRHAPVADRFVAKAALAGGAE